MNLQRMRDANWRDVTLRIIANLSASNSWVYASDQDVLNYYNGLHPDHLYELSCAYNWRWSLCRKFQNYSQECADATRNGVTVIHGVSGTFFKSNVFLSRLYRIFSKFEMGGSIQDGLIQPITDALRRYASSMCANVTGDVYLKQMTNFVSNMTS